MPSSQKINHEEPEYLPMCSLTLEECRKLANGSAEDRFEATLPLRKATKEEITSIEPLSFLEEALCVMILAFGPPNGVFSLPLVTWGIGSICGNVSKAFQVLGIGLLPLFLLPQPFIPSMLQSSISNKLLKYFSYRVVMEERPQTMTKADSKDQHGQIYVAPPHGVFPYGNILAMLSWPTVTGHHFRGLASSAALRPPVFKQMLRSIGVIDASRHVARRALETYPYCIGISTGGVAEVFETNADDECIVLKERIGLVKLAIRTGSDLVPCYLFGNTKLLSCWAGEGIPKGRATLEKISRKLGFALILIFGRWLLPIPRRVPIYAVIGKRIPTHYLQCEDPTMEQVEMIQKQLLGDMQTLFDKYKHFYGWEHKQLIVK